MNVKQSWSIRFWLSWPNSLRNQVFGDKMSESTQQSPAIQLQLENEKPSIHYNDSSIATLKAILFEFMRSGSTVFQRARQFNEDHNLFWLWVNYNVWSLCGGGNFRRENHPGFQVEKKDPVVSASEKIAGHQRSPGLARWGEIDCFRFFGDKPDERSHSGAIFFLDAWPKIWKILLQASQDQVMSPKIPSLQERNFASVQHMSKRASLSTKGACAVNLRVPPPSQNYLESVSCLWLLEGRNEVRRHSFQILVGAESDQNASHPSIPKTSLEFLVS